MSLHRFVITSLIAVTAVAAPTWEPLAAQNAPQDTAGITTPIAPIVSARPIPSTSSMDGASIDRSLLSETARMGARSEARQLVPTAPMFRAAESSSAATSKTMMIVGGAGLIVGAVVGGAPGLVVMVGGSVVGLVGLLNYLK
jgi:hypothetical protein